jgi:MIP family channel proteins
MYTILQKLTAEFLGTFALVFFGEGAICADQSLHGAGSLGLFGIAAAHGLAVATLFCALSRVSGGHFNPAVTIGFWVTKRVSTMDVVLYWIAQLAGAILAAFVLKAIIPEDTWRAVALGTPELVRDFSRLSAMALEALATFFLVLVFFATGLGATGVATVEATALEDRGVSRAVAGFAIGLTVALGIMVAGPFTGGALNPARAFGPALASWHWASQGVFWVGPLAGGFLAGLLYDSVFLKKQV